MARQKSLSLLEFQEKFNTEEACQEHFLKCVDPTDIVVQNAVIQNITLLLNGIRQMRFEFMRKFIKTVMREKHNHYKK